MTRSNAFAGLRRKVSRFARNAGPWITTVLLLHKAVKTLSPPQRGMAQHHGDDQSRDGRRQRDIGGKGSERVEHVADQAADEGKARRPLPVRLSDTLGNEVAPAAISDMPIP